MVEVEALGTTGTIEFFSSGGSQGFNFDHLEIDAASYIVNDAGSSFFMGSLLEASRDDGNADATVSVESEVDTGESGPLEIEWRSNGYRAYEIEGTSVSSQTFPNLTDSHQVGGNTDRDSW